ncbi:MAG: tetratricopeptide repeat protein [Bacteroidia bacterium]
MAKSRQTPPKQVIKTTQNQVVTPKTISEPLTYSGLPTWANPYLLAAVLALFSFLLYFPTANFEYSFDDDIYTNRNDVCEKGLNDNFQDIFHKGSLWGFEFLRKNTGVYRPITILSFATEKAVTDAVYPENAKNKDGFGFSMPGISHKINLVLHALQIGLLFLLLFRIFKGTHWVIPVLITLLFAAHPMHTEVVANVKSRDELLVFLFFTISGHFFWSYLQDKKWQNMAISVLFFFLSTMSKENGFTFLAVYPLMVWYFKKDEDWEWGNIIITCLPFLIGAVIFLGLRKNALTEDDHAELLLVNNSVLAAGTRFSTETSLFASKILMLGQYAYKLLVPFPLSYDYSFNQIPCATWGDWRVLLTLLVYGGLGFLTFRAFTKKESWGFGLLFFVITFSVNSNLFVKMAATLAERFLYIPSLGFLIFCVVGLYELLKRRESLPIAPILTGVFGLLTVVYAGITWNRLPVWKNNHTLFEAGVVSSPNSFRTQFNLAETYRVDGDQSKEEAKKLDFYKKAAERYEKSLAIYPEYNLAWMNMGLCYTALKDTNKAMYSYENMLKLAPDGNSSNAANNLGAMYFNRKNYEKAKVYFSKSTQFNPNNFQALSNLALVQSQFKDYQNSIKNYEQAIRVSGNQVQPQWIQNLVNLYTVVGNAEKAAQYQAMLRK